MGFNCICIYKYNVFQQRSLDDSLTVLLMWRRIHESAKNFYWNLAEMVTLPGDMREASFNLELHMFL